MLVAAIHETMALGAKATLVSARLAFGALMQQQAINIFRRLSLADELRESSAPMPDRSCACCLLMDNISVQSREDNPHE